MDQFTQENFFFNVHGALKNIPAYFRTLESGRKAISIKILTKEPKLRNSRDSSSFLTMFWQKYQRQLFVEGLQ